MDHESFLYMPSVPEESMDMCLVRRHSDSHGGTAIGQEVNTVNRQYNACNNAVNQKLRTPGTRSRQKATESHENQSFQPARRKLDGVVGVDFEKLLGIFLAKQRSLSRKKSVSRKIAEEMGEQAQVEHSAQRSQRVDVGEDQGLRENRNENDGTGDIVTADSAAVPASIASHATGADISEKPVHNTGAEKTETSKDKPDIKPDKPMPDYKKVAEQITYLLAEFEYHKVMRAEDVVCEVFYEMSRRLNGVNNTNDSNDANVANVACSWSSCTGTAREGSDGNSPVKNLFTGGFWGLRFGKQI